MYRRIVFMLGAFLLTISTQAFASTPIVDSYTPNLSLGARASTAGFGGEATTAITDWLAVRVGINYFTYSYSGTKSNVDYDFDLDLLNGPILLDWHPFKGAFRISGGVLINGNELNAKGKPVASGTFDLNGTTYTAAQVGNLEGKIDFNSVAPYLGLGVDTSFGKERGFGFVFELGAFYQGSPDVTFSASGPIATNAAFIHDLKQEEADLQSAIDFFKVYPVLAVGVNYRF